MPTEWGKGLAFSPDGCLLAASSHLHYEILHWDLAAGRERDLLRGHGSSVISLAFAPDGRSLASGGPNDTAIVLWELATFQPRRRLRVPTEPVKCLAYSPNGLWLASTGDRGRDGRLWDLESGAAIGLLARARNSVAFSPDERRLATAGDNGAVRLLDLGDLLRSPDAP